MNYLKLRLYVFIPTLLLFSGILSTINGQGTKTPELLLNGKIVEYKDRRLTKTYGDGSFTLDFTSSSGGKITYSMRDEPAISLSGNEVTIKKVGVARITANIEAKGEYKAGRVLVYVYVNQAPLTMTIGNVTRRVDEPNPGATATITGFVNGEDKSILGLAETAWTHYTGGPDWGGGTYDIEASAALKDKIITLGNYRLIKVTKGILTVTKLPQTISFVLTPTSVFYDEMYGKQGSVTLTATASSTEAITYTSSDEDIAYIEGNKLYVNGAGVVQITASQPGTNRYEAAAPVSQTFTVVLRSEAKVFLDNKEITGSEYGSLVEKNYGDADFILNITSNSTGKIHLSCLNGVVSFSGKDGKTVKINKGGRAQIKAIVAATDKHRERTVEFTIRIKRIAGFILIDGKKYTSYGTHKITKTYGDASFTLGVTASSDNVSHTLEFLGFDLGGAISLSGAKNDVVTINHSTDYFHIQSKETVTIRAADNENYLQAVLTVEITVKRAPLTMTIADVTRRWDEPNPYDNVTFTGFVNGEDENVLGVPANNLLVYTGSSVGIHEIKADTRLSQTLLEKRKYKLIVHKGKLTVTAIPKKAQTIDFKALPAIVFVETRDVIRLQAKATSGNTVSFKSSDTDIVDFYSNGGPALYLKKPGTVKITASQAGNDGWLAAPEITYTIVVKKGSPEAHIEANGKELASGANIDLGTTKKNFIWGKYDDLSQDLTIRNLGTASLQVSSASISGSDASEFEANVGFAVTNGIVKPHQTGTLYIKFKPTSPGVKTAKVTITTNDTDEGTYTFNITAKAESPVMEIVQEDQTVIADKGSYNFGEVSEGMATFTLKNTGNVEMLAGYIIVYASGNDKDSFEIIDRPTKNIPAGGSTTLKVQFKSALEGSKTTNLVIRYGHPNTSNPDTYLIILTGTIKNQVTGLPTTLQNATLKTGPNPATSYITLQLTGQASPKVQYQLINTQGKAVIEGQSNLKNGRMIINLNEVKQGNYLLKLQLGKEQIIRRIIKL